MHAVRKWLLQERRRANVLHSLPRRIIHQWCARSDALHVRDRLQRHMVGNHPMHGLRNRHIQVFQCGRQLHGVWRWLDHAQHCIVLVCVHGWVWWDVESQY